MDDGAVFGAAKVTDVGAQQFIGAPYVSSLWRFAISRHFA
jgi:hypothetical protein